MRVELEVELRWEEEAYVKWSRWTRAVPKTMARVVADREVMIEVAEVDQVAEGPVVEADQGALEAVEMVTEGQEAEAVEVALVEAVEAALEEEVQEEMGQEAVQEEDQGEMVQVGAMQVEVEVRVQEEEMTVEEVRVVQGGREETMTKTVLVTQRMARVWGVRKM